MHDCQRVDRFMTALACLLDNLEEYLSASGFEQYPNWRHLIESCYRTQPEERIHYLTRFPVGSGANGLPLQALVFAGPERPIGIDLVSTIQLFNSQS